MKAKKVYLSFDVEEFDLPREHGEEISLEEGVEVSAEGLEKILGILEKTGAKATFFVTANFAKQRPEMVRKLVLEGYEVGCHGVDHFRPKKTDMEVSKREIEKITGVKAVGWRQPRMQKIDYKGLFRLGFLYDSSVNPAFIPGRYNNFRMEREPYFVEVSSGRSESGASRGKSSGAKAKKVARAGVKDERILEIPVSVGTRMRVPMFWLSLHLFPFLVYSGLAKGILKSRGRFLTYFHPWEFSDIKNRKGIPGFIKANSGEKLCSRLEKLIVELKKEGAEFSVYREILEERQVFTEK